MAVRRRATLPDGERRSLIRITDWDMNWQDRYLYAEPFWLPAGTRLSLEYVFDNSEGNPRNPDRPPARATWGWRSSDEMADLWIQVLTRTDNDRARLRRETSIKMQTKTPSAAKCCCDESRTTRTFATTQPRRTCRLDNETWR